MSLLCNVINSRNTISHLIADVAKQMSQIVSALSGHCGSAVDLEMPCGNMSQLSHKQSDKFICGEFTITQNKFLIHPTVAWRADSHTGKDAASSDILDPEKTGHNVRTRVIAGAAS
jgi:hypothetical protein